MYSSVFFYKKVDDVVVDWELGERKSLRRKGLAHFGSAFTLL
jgi:hypothetical protein